MGAAFWIFLAATVVATMTFVSVVVWAEKRLEERKEYYRFEFRKRMVEEGKLDGEGVARLMRYENEIGQQQSRAKILVAGFIFTGVGIGLCFGLRFIEGLLWMIGYLPIAIGLSLLAYGLLVAAKPKPGEPPAGWMPQPGEKD